MTLTRVTYDLKQIPALIGDLCVSFYVCFNDCSLVC